MVGIFLPMFVATVLGRFNHQRNCQKRGGQTEEGEEKGNVDALKKGLDREEDDTDNALGRFNHQRNCQKRGGQTEEGEEKGNVDALKKGLDREEDDTDNAFRKIVTQIMVINATVGASFMFFGMVESEFSFINLVNEDPYFCSCRCGRFFVVHDRALLIRIVHLRNN